MGKRELHDIDAKIVHETKLAYLLDVGLDKPIWVPRSIAEDNGDGTFTIPFSFAKEKGLV